MESEAITQTSIAAHASQSEVHLIHRILRACLHEALIPHFFQDNVLFIPLKKNKKLLVATQVMRCMLDKFIIRGTVFAAFENQFQPVHHLDVFMDLIELELSSKVDAVQWNQFRFELSNCKENIEVSESFLKKFNAYLKQKIQQSNMTHLIRYIEKHYSTHEQFIFFEMWGSNGHPYHPCHKTKLGFSQKEYTLYSCEFNSCIALHVGLVLKSLMHVESSESDFNYNQWFSTHYPRIWEAICAECKSQSLDESQYYPLFLHPWQNQHIIQTRYCNLIEAGQLIVFDHIRYSTYSGLSLRTMIPEKQQEPHHIKLPVAVQCTSAMRTILPASIQNTPRLSRILEIILKQETYFDHTIRFAFERCGMHYLHPDPDVAKHLSISYRENPERYVDANQIPIVVAALFSLSPVNQTPLLIEIMQLGGLLDSHYILNYFDQYSQIVLRSFLDLFLIYGIALEGHQQNTIAVFEQEQPVFMIARDLGGVRIHLPTLQSNGFFFNSYPDSKIVNSNPQESTNKFLHSVVQYHLGEIALMLSNYFSIPEIDFWNILKKNIKNRFDICRHRMSEERWNREYHAVFESDWQSKSLMKMRLQNVYNNYIYTSVSNPLRDF